MPEEFMKEALKEAQKAMSKEEVPIGAVIVKDGKIIARGHNLRETKKDACAHAEIIAIQKACKKLDAWRLEDCEIYVTLEPCSMCAGAIMNARIKKLYIGAMEPKSGSVGSKLNLLGDYTFNHKVEVVTGICEEESVRLLKDFFQYLRKKDKEKK
ncbi:MAG: tRNA adenosine(34) deaminase TadA [Clostridia bacterium]|nr:tRNA adenosine(34) deaminase TadA [Clostridia bacterium]